MDICEINLGVKTNAYIALKEFFFKSLFEIVNFLMLVNIWLRIKGNVFLNQVNNLDRPLYFFGPKFPYI